MADRVEEAAKRYREKPPLERWNELIQRGAIDSKGRVLLKAPRPMMGGEAEPKRKGRRPSK